MRKIIHAKVQHPVRFHLKFINPKIINKTGIHYQSFTWWIILFAMLTIQSCNTENCLQSAGPSKTYNKQLDSIDIIEIYDVFDVVFVPDSANFMEVTCGENLYDGLHFSKEEGKLIIEDHNSCSFVRSYDNVPLLTVHSNTINHIIIPGNVKLTMNDTLVCDSFKLDVKGGINNIDLKLKANRLEYSVNGGTGDYSLSGSAGLTYLYFFGTGFFWGENFESGYYYIQQRSTGDMHVNAKTELNLKSYSNGDTYYYSNPDTIIYQSVSGRGELIQAI